MPSSVIRSYKYLAGTKTLLVTFVSGKIYQYAGVGKTRYQEFRKAFSKGTYFNKYIRPFYAYSKLSS